jgi:hypothetical protein
VVGDWESGTSRDFGFIDSGKRANIYLERGAEIVGLVGYNGSLDVLFQRVMTVWKGASLHAALPIR